MELEHTPGPWKCYNAKGGRILDAWRVSADDNTPISTVIDAGNAHLCAAAPDLYETLRTVLVRLELEAAQHPGKVFPCAAMIGDIRALLARAGGAA